jgi:hypothetical protein
MRKLFLLSALLLVLASGCTAFSQPVIINFSANPGIITAGSSSTLIWNVTGANSVRIEPDLGYVAVAGTHAVSPAATVTYTITASNGAGSVTASAVVTVNPAPQPPLIASFTSNPAIITSGDTAVLQWNVNGAGSVSIAPDIGAVAASGTRNVSPKNTTTYTLTAVNNSGPVTATTVITVNPLAQPPVVVDFSVSPSTVILGQTATLYWNVNGTNNVYIDNGIGSVPPVGSQTVSPGYSTTYTLTASNAAGTVTRTAYVDIWYPSPYPGPFPPFSNLPLIVSFDINPPLVPSGTPTTMSWLVNGASSIYINNGIGLVPPSGSHIIIPGVSTVYTLTATNSFGTVNSTATVIVSSSSGSPVITTFTVSPTSILAGQSATLQWAVNGATAISINNGIGAVGPNGSRTVTPSGSITYTLTASNSSGMVQHTANLVVTPASPLPVIGSFTATPSEIESGHSSNLAWTVSGATTVSIDHGIGTVGLTGNVNVTPASTTTYTISAIGPGGSVVRTVRIRVEGGGG